MSTSESPRIKALRGLRDPLARAKQAQELIEYARGIEAEARAIRDESIREAHAAGRPNTVDHIARQVGAKRNIVVDALRGRHRD